MENKEDGKDGEKNQKSQAERVTTKTEFGVKETEGEMIRAN